jgi:rhamnogalacturonyl hydrolase YesR
MTVTATEQPPAIAMRAAKELERWGSDRRWAGTDPYDGLNATRIPRSLRRSPLALRVLTQGVKRSPLNLRPLLGIPTGVSAATLGLVISAYARNGFLEEAEAREKLKWSIDRLVELRSPGFEEPCWGYHFDVQTRVFFYPRTMPNTIATAFAGLGLLDAYELAGDRRALDLARGAADFFVRHVPQTETEHGAYFGYLPGDGTPIHNASMLVCALLARLASLLDDERLAARAAAGVKFTVRHIRVDGSWRYGEKPDLGWVDGFHTGYVLDCLLDCLEAGIGDPASETAWRRGLQYYMNALIEADGTPRYTPRSRYPVDGQCCAQALQTLSRATVRDPDLTSRRDLVLDWTLRNLRQPDGEFAFQKERLWLNRASHPRWVEAPMLAALTHFLTAP